MTLFTVDFFKRLNALGRVTIWGRSPKEAKRYNENSSKFEIKLTNKQEAEVWLPVDYCLRGEFTGTQLDTLRDSLE